MERNSDYCGLQQSRASSSSLAFKKPERKVIEKNRRNQMKFLYSQLSSLLPDHHLTSKGAALMPERVEEAIEYIKSLKTKLETSKAKKEKLLTSRKRSYEYMASDSFSTTTTCIPPNIEIHEMGPDLDIVLITGIPNKSSFCDIIRVLDECSDEVVQASFSASGSSTFHIHHKKIGAEEMSKRLKGLFEGSSSNQESAHGSSYNETIDSNLEIEGFLNNQESTHASSHNKLVDSSLLDLWDFEIHPDTWEMMIPEVMPMRI